MFLKTQVEGFSLCKIGTINADNFIHARDSMLLLTLYFRKDSSFLLTLYVALVLFFALPFL